LISDAADDRFDQHKRVFYEQVTDVKFIGFLLLLLFLAFVVPHGPGVGHLTALTFLLTLGGKERFEQSVMSGVISGADQGQSLATPAFAKRRPACRYMPRMA
jgi:hypothetical protein